jgi:thiamine-monophosphate kinase
MRPSEDDLIARYFAPMAGEGGLGLRDDVALIGVTPGHQIVLTVDAIVEGVHFLAEDPADTVGVKALGVNLSDLAAKGAKPIGFLLTLALPEGWSEPWLARFCEGLGRMAEASGCPLLGGDTVRARGTLTLSITAIGEVPDGRMVPRTGARPGDVIGVTGTVGDATLGLALLVGSPDWHGALRPEHRAFLVDRYREPRPRLSLAPDLRDCANAAMDVSDGLAGDAAKLLGASGVGGMLDLDALPLSGAASLAIRSDETLRDRVATGGDDYEILFTVPERSWDRLASVAGAKDVPVTRIGRVGMPGGPVSFERSGRPVTLSSLSYQHSWGSA